MAASHVADSRERAMLDDDLGMKATFSMRDVAVMDIDLDYIEVSGDGQLAVDRLP
jgi:hypothetical protein